MFAGPMSAIKNFTLNYVTHFIDTFTIATRKRRTFS